MADILQVSDDGIIRLSLEFNRDFGGLWPMVTNQDKKHYVAYEPSSPINLDTRDAIILNPVIGVNKGCEVDLSELFPESELGTARNNSRVGCLQRVLLAAPGEDTDAKAERWAIPAIVKRESGFGGHML
jgi:hypothetical protein